MYIQVFILLQQLQPFLYIYYVEIISSAMANFKKSCPPSRFMVDRFNCLYLSIDKYVCRQHHYAKLYKFFSHKQIVVTLQLIRLRRPLSNEITKRTTGYEEHINMVHMFVYLCLLSNGSLLFASTYICRTAITQLCNNKLLVKYQFNYQRRVIKMITESQKAFNIVHTKLLFGLLL